MSGSSRPTSARTRSWHGAWRLRMLHKLLSLRLLRLLFLVLGLPKGMMTAVPIMVSPLIIPQFSLITQVLLAQLGRPRRCTLRATTLRTSWGPWLPRA